MSTEEPMDIAEDLPVAASSSGAGANPKSSLPWVEKYRPSSLDELIAHEDIIKILNQLIDTNKLPHLLFYGPPGTGTCFYPFYSVSYFPQYSVLQVKHQLSLPAQKRCMARVIVR